jgi:hypothetical protein
VTGIEDLVTRLIGENIVLTTSLAAELGAVGMDPSQVQQILLNLVLNARDAMPGGGQITLTTRNCTDAKNSWVELSVTDSGGGMPKPWSAPSSPSSPPSNPAAATDWDWPPPAAWPGSKAEPSSRRVSRERAHGFACVCRESRPTPYQLRKQR